MNLPETLRALTDPFPVWLLWLTAVIGHGFLATTGLNLLYSYPLPRNLLKITRKVDILFVLCGPFLFAWILDLWGSPGLHWENPSIRHFLAPYTVFCCFFGLVAAPIAQIRYWLRPTAAALIHEDSEVIDVAQQLGAPPTGRGKHHRVTLWPGNQVFEVEFRRLTFHIPNLPEEWEGLTILHLTDLHFCGTPDREFHRFVIDKCMADGEPDIVAITGDVVDSSWHHRWIVPLLGKLRWKLAGYAILGNHDALRDTTIIRRRLARVGLNVLGNGFHRLEVRGIPMLVIGNETPWFKPGPDATQWPDAVFKLCLSHTPDTIAWARKIGIDLVLAGHVHGGQIRLPLIGSIFCPSRYSRRYDCGTFFEAPTLMHVSRGLAGQHPLRYRCRPEVTRIVLTRKASVDS